MNIQDIPEKEIFTTPSSNAPDNMIAAAVYLRQDDGYAQHAAIFMAHKGIKRIFHFTGKEVLLENIEDVKVSYECKEFNFMRKELLPWFISQCELIKENAQPKYGFFYDGSYYDPNTGNFISPGQFPQYMTCVGFCLNVLNAFAEENDLFDYSAWDSTSLEELRKSYLEEFISKVKESNPELDIEEFQKNMRRITPIEYFAAAFSESLPITQAFINTIIQPIELLFKQKMVRA